LRESIKKSSLNDGHELYILEEFVGTFDETTLKNIEQNYILAYYNIDPKKSLNLAVEGVAVKDRNRLRSSLISSKNYSTIEKSKKKYVDYEIERETKEIGKFIKMINDINIKGGGTRAEQDNMLNIYTDLYNRLEYYEINWSGDGLGNWEIDFKCGDIYFSEKIFDENYIKFIKNENE
jgi:hypothetical protein